MEAAASMIGANRSVSNIESRPWRMGRIRSRPAPVSMFLLRQVGTGAVGVAVELHEDEVPELDEALLAAVLGAAVVRRRPGPCR